MFHELENSPLIPIMQFKLQRCPVSARFGRLEDAVEDIVFGPISTTSVWVWPRVPSVISQQRVRHQVDRLGSVGKTLKQQLGLHEVKPLQQKHKDNLISIEDVSSTSSKQSLISFGNTKKTIQLYLRLLKSDEAA